MGRPSITGDSVVVAVDDDLLVWTDGLISGTNPALVKEAKWLAKYNIPVDLTPDGPTVLADSNNITAPEQAAAALLGAAPGRGRLLQAPQFVLDLLPYDSEEPGEGTDVMPDSNNEEKQPEE